MFKLDGIHHHSACWRGKECLSHTCSQQLHLRAMLHMQGKSIKASHISTALLSPEDAKKQWLYTHCMHPSKVCPLFSGHYVLAEEKLPQHQNLKAQIPLISWQMPPCPHPCWKCVSFSAGWTKTVTAILCFSTIKYQSKSQSNKLESVTETALMELRIPLTLPKKPCHLSRRSFAFTQKGSAPQRNHKDASRHRRSSWGHEKRPLWQKWKVTKQQQADHTACTFCFLATFTYLNSSFFLHLNFVSTLDDL